MKVYVAAPWVRKAEARQVANTLLSEGHDVISRWLWLHGDSDDPVTLANEAQNDIDDLDAADVLLLVNLEQSEGKAVETGVMLAQGKPVVVIGGRSNIFHHLPRIHHVHTIDQAINRLKEIACRA
jgi:nucleoside 2-deoxyribosyltransferase